MNLEKIEFEEKYNGQIRLFSRRVRHTSFHDEYIDVEIYYDYISISSNKQPYYYKNKINLENVSFRLHDNIICINEYYLSLHKKKINFYIVLFGDFDSLMIVELCYNSKTNSLSFVKYNKFSLHHLIYKEKTKIEHIYLNPTKYSFFLLFEKDDNNTHNPENLIIEKNFDFIKYSFSYHFFTINQISISEIHNLNEYTKFSKIENDVYSNEFINQQFNF